MCKYIECWHMRMNMHHMYIPFCRPAYAREHVSFVHPILSTGIFAWTRIIHTSRSMWKNWHMCVNMHHPYIQFCVLAYVREHASSVHPVLSDCICAWSCIIHTPRSVYWHYMRMNTIIRTSRSVYGHRYASEHASSVHPVLSDTGICAWTFIIRKPRSVYWYMRVNMHHTYTPFCLPAYACEHASSVHPVLSTGICAWTRIIRTSRTWFFFILY